MRLAAITTTTAVVLALVVGLPRLADAATGGRSPVAEFPGPATVTPTLIPGAWSSVTTDDAGATMTFHTSGLAPRHAVTVWWIVFNDPAACTSGHFGFRCGPGDLSDPNTGASVLYAAGHVLGGNGTAGFGARLNRDDTAGALFGPGLTNPTGADIHLVVHDHGAADPALLPAQIHSFDVCNGGCTDVQVSVHEQ